MHALSKGVSVSYFSHMSRLIALDASVYHEMMKKKLSLRYCVLNVFIAGLIYGVSSAWITKSMNFAAKNGDAVVFSPLVVILVGVSLAYLIHGGTALFIWVFCKGIGGCSQFMPPYLNLGVASVVLWPLLPVVAMFQVGFRFWVLDIYLVVFTIFSMISFYLAVKCVSGLSTTKMVIAFVGTIIYVGCFLYLWS